MAMASGFDKIFEVGPVFRAEKSYTNRHTTEFTGFDIEISYINSFEDKPSHLIMILHRAQGLFGYLPKELQIFVAEKTGVPSAKVYGVVTFYSFFTISNFHVFLLV